MKFFTSVAAAAIAAASIATPAQAQRVDPMTRFVIARSITLCYATTGRAQAKDVIRYEQRALFESGMTKEQYLVFNEQSGPGEFVGNLVDRYTREEGGCEGILREARPAQRQIITPKPTTNLPYPYTL